MNASRLSASRTASKGNDQGYRKINFVESGYTYEHAKNPDQRFHVVSPYMNGKKNSLFLNPSLYTSSELQKTGDVKAKITPYGTSRNPHETSTARKLHFDERPAPVVQNQRVHTEVAKAPSDDRVIKTEARENEMKIPDGSINNNIFLPKNSQAALPKAKDITPVNTNKTPNVDKSPKLEVKNNEKKSSEQSPTNEFINICDGCFNKELMTEQQMMHEQQRLKELELERQALNYDHYLYRTQLTAEKHRKEAIKRISDANHEAMTVKKQSIHDRLGEYDLSPSEVKLHSPEKSRLYKSSNQPNLLDNIFHSSEKYDQERQVSASGILLNH